MRKSISVVLTACTLLVASLFLAPSSEGLVALCVTCENYRCKYIYHDGHSRCNNSPYGCVAAGQCTLNYSITP